MSIEEENKHSKEYLLQLDFIDENKKIPEITLMNIAKIEAMIEMNPTYSNNSNDAFEGSSANLFKKLKEELNKANDEDQLNEEIIHKIVLALDKENSTHLKAIYKNINGINGPKEIAEAISKFKKGDFIKHLMNPDIALTPEFGLFRIIEDKKIGGKKNTSFASKFCHYSCFYLFNNNENFLQYKNNDKNILTYRDNYSIYDSVLKRILPIYIKYYNIKIENIKNTKKYSTIKNHLNKIDYNEYQNIIDIIITTSKSNISRNGFDHLLWYYFKGKKEDEIKEIYDNINNRNKKG